MMKKYGSLKIFLKPSIKWRRMVIKTFKKKNLKYHTSPYVLQSIVEFVISLLKPP